MKHDKNYERIHKMILANKIHRQAIETAIDDIGIHRGQHLILMNLAREEKISSQKEIAERLGITQAAMTMALSRLERDGLIERKAGSDSRYNETLITEKGKDIVSRSRDHFSEVDKAAFSGIEDAELEVFEKCIDKICSNLNEYLGKEKK